MSYQALYRVWRSQTFADMVGQELITKTLKNAITQNKISHAYLFTGPRGTGKTSAAKILAKAVNCPNQVDGEPCNKCEICQEITEGRLNDVIEIDAASNNGVDEIREIRDKVKYAPTQAKYKVYIIDEVHMLSTGAFNALLKTLEEPPNNVIFILATTEPHKIPATIISRTQRFDFKRISVEDIYQHLAHIMQTSEQAYDEKALYVIARAAEGGMRDALSILDQAISYSDDGLTLVSAMEVTGTLTDEMMEQYLAACYEQDSEQALNLLGQIMAEGRESNRFLENMMIFCRDLLVFQEAPNFLLQEKGYVSEGLKKLAQKISSNVLQQYILEFNQGQNDLKYTAHGRIYLEMITTKLCHLRLSGSEQSNVSSVNEAELSELLNKVNALEQKIAMLQKTEPLVEVQKVAPKVPNKTTYRIPTELIYQVLDAASKQILVQVHDHWVDLLQLLSVSQRAILKSCEPVAASENGLVLAFQYSIICQKVSDDGELQQAITNSLNRLLEYQPTIQCIPFDEWQSLRKEYLLKNQHIQTKITAEGVEIPTAESEPTQQIVEQALEIFGSEHIEVIDD